MYVGSHSGKFACIDAEFGVEHWTRQLPDRIEASATISACGSFIYIGKQQTILLKNKLIIFNLL